VQKGVVMTDGFVPGVVVPAEVAGHRFLHVVDGSVFIDEDVDVVSMSMSRLGRPISSA
jgi:hypothetical protein